MAKAEFAPAPGAVYRQRAERGQSGAGAMKTFVKFAVLFISFGIGVAFAIAAIHAFVYPGYFSSAGDAVLPGMFAAIFLLGAFLVFRWQPNTNEGKYRAGTYSQNRFRSFDPIISHKDEKVNRRESQSAMTNGWHYIEGTTPVGPVDLDQLQLVLSRISDPRNLLVWNAGFNEWQRAGEVPELEALIYKPPPPPVAPFARPVAKPQSDWKWTSLQSILYVLIVGIATMSNVLWQWAPSKLISLLSGIAVASVLTVAQQGRKEARYVRNYCARYCSWGGSFGLQVY